MSVNLTGGQIQQALDYLIYESLRPIVLNSDVFDAQVAYLLNFASSNKKRKLSALPREDFMSNMASVLAETDKSIKFNVITQSKIERGFVYNFVVNFINAVGDYEERYANYLTCRSATKRKLLDMSMNATEKGVGFSRDTLLPSLRYSESHLTLMYTFRNGIVCQYLKHARKQAGALCESQGRTFSKADVEQNLLLATTRAVDKYDASKGALTSYINWWLMSAMTYSSSTHGHEYGIAYTVPQQLRKDMVAGKTGEVNFSVSLDKAFGDEGEGDCLGAHIEGAHGVDIDVEESDESRALARLIKRSDPGGLARLYLDLEEAIFPEEERVMRSTMRSQLGVVPKSV